MSLKREDPSKVAQTSSEGEAYVVLRQMFLTLHLQETGVIGILFVTSDGHREEGTFSIQMSSLLYYKTCRSHYLKSKICQS